MRRLTLDFAERTALNKTGLALLAAGAIAAAACADQWLDLREQVALSEARVADLKRLAQRKMNRVDERGPDAKELNAEAQRANAILRQMTVPWNELFRSLETASGESVALLSIQPDAAGQQLRIAGEAKNVAALFAYMTQLERNATLVRVILTGHEIKANGSQRPIRFSLTAEWMAHS